MENSAQILVIDDEAVVRNSCREILARSGSAVSLAETGAAGLAAMAKDSYDIVVLDLKMPGMDGMEVLRQIGKDHPKTIVIVITGYATVESAVEAMRLGAYDFVPKPFTPDEFRAVINRSLEKRQLLMEKEYLEAELRSRVGMERIIGSSGHMKKVNELVERVGPTDSTVLITGESGTGKELVARAIHRASLRAGKPFVVADCGALVENLFESELFGHVKGAFTGATETKHGRFELANGGTLFLDEIGNIGVNVQSRLLRAIQEREVTKVGSAKPTRIDVRIIAATNKELREMVSAGSFRDDLFYRLSVVPINLPPLRERSDDIPLLAEYFLEEYNRKRRKSIRGIAREAMQMLVSYAWPGNVRELENAIERAVVLTRGEVIEPRDLTGLSGPNPPRAGETGQLSRMEIEQIHKALREFGGNRTKAARFLGIDRKTLSRKLKRSGPDSAETE